MLDFTLQLGDAGSWMTRLPAEAGGGCVQLLTNSGVVLAEAVRKGAGIALLPSYGSVFEAGFAPVELGLHYDVPFWLCARQDAMSRQPVRQVARFLRHVFDRKTMPWFEDGYRVPSGFPKTSPQSILASLSEVSACDSHDAAKTQRPGGRPLEI